MPLPDLGYAVTLPPADAIAYLKAKGYEIGWSWQDVWQEAHAKAFTAAGVMKVDVLADLKGGLVKALEEGKTRQDYINQVAPLLQAKGWWGAVSQTDKETGEVFGKGLTPRRLATIFDTNMQSAYMAGRYKAFMANVADRPYWMYVAIMDRRTRPAHAAMNGRTFRYDDPIWNSSFPPNGFRCRCSVRALDAEDVKSRGIDLSTSDGRLSEIEIATSKKPDAPTATVTRFEYAPGKYFHPDAGWSYNPGKAGLEHLNELAAAKAAAQPGPLGQALTQAIAQAPSKPEFVEAKTAKEAAAWAMKNGLADFADYTGVAPEVANAWNRSLFEHLQEFPELRKNQKFVGTCQAQYSRFRELTIQRLLDALVRANPGRDLSALRAVAEKSVKRMVVDNRYAHSWAQADVSGIAVNKKWGGDVVKFKDSLAAGATSRWHPVGCDTIRSVVDHQVGHQLDDLLKLSIDPELNIVYNRALKVGITAEVSGYAGKNIGEFLAECWAESCNNPAPREAARTVAAIIRERYRTRYP